MREKPDLNMPVNKRMYTCHDEACPLEIFAIRSKLTPDYASGGFATRDVRFAIIREQFASSDLVGNTFARGSGTNFPSTLFANRNSNLRRFTNVFTLFATGHTEI